MNRVWVSSAAVQDPLWMARAGEDQLEQLRDLSTAPVVSPGIHWPQGPAESVAQQVTDHYLLGTQASTDQFLLLIHISLTQSPYQYSPV